MPFRIGFEGQMEGQLCMQALARPAIQKKPIFEMRSEGIKLWHVEFDGPDLEFVTVPFSHEERARVQACMDSIQRAVNVLMSLLSDNDTLTVIGWFTSLGDGKFISDQSFFDEQNIGTVQINKVFADWQPIWRPQVTIQHPLRSTMKLYTAIFEDTNNVSEDIAKVIPREVDPNTALGGLVFLQAHEMLSMTNSVYMAINDQGSNIVLATALAMYFIDKEVPQKEITLEGVLEVIGDRKVVSVVSKYYGNALSLYLCSKYYGDSSAYIKALLLSNPKMKQLSPDLQKMIEAFYDQGDRCNHIADLLCRAKEEEDFILQSVLFMMQTWQNLNDLNQFDAKRFTLFMSRRPFSYMLSEIATAANDKVLLTDVASKELLVKRNFTDIFRGSTSQKTLGEKIL